MSLSTALEDMRRANTNLRDAVAELVMTVLDDRPLDGEIAVVDNLGERVSELQASIVEAGVQLESIKDVRHLPRLLPQIDGATTASIDRYWRDLRSHETVAELRTAVRSRGVEWRTWQGSVEQSQLRCEVGIDEASASLRAAWREVGELLTLYLPMAEPVVPANLEATPPGATGISSTNTRRPS